MKYVCSICGYVYDEGKEGKLFADLPDSWACPLCGAAKSAFALEQKAQVPQAPAAPIQIDEDMKKLSAGELSALCSNLARGCEKQYKEEEAALFREIADYFAAAAPAVPDADTAQLAELIQRDLNEGYLTAARSASVFGEKR